MNYKIVITLVVTILFSFVSLSQSKNLLLNGDFENVKKLPNPSNVITDNLNNYLYHWSSPNNRTPDLFSTLFKDSQCLSLPHSNLAYWMPPDSLKYITIYPYKGNNIIGFYSIDSTKAFYGNEFVQNSSLNLKRNHKYRFTLHYQQGVRYYYFNNLSIAFTKNPIHSNGINIRSYSLDRGGIFNLPLLRSRQWIETSITLKSTDTFKNIIIGCFNDGNGTIWNKNDTILRNFTGDSYYVFLDDLSLEELPCIVSPDTACTGQPLIISTTLGMPYYWSTKPNGSDTISTDSLYSFKATANRTIYAFGKHGTDSLNLIVVKGIQKPNWQDTFNTCYGSYIFLDAGPPSYSYLWNNGSKKNSVTVNSTGQYKVFVSNYYGCKDSFSAMVNINPLPVISVKDTFSICEALNESANIDAGNQYKCEWIPNNNGCQYLANKAENILLTVTNENNCIAYKNILVLNECSLISFLPNAIHIDGVNKTFAPQITHAKNIELKIFNRWGEVLYFERGMTVEWDGKYKEEYCMPGLYFYIITIEPADGSETKITNGYIRLF